MFKYALIILLLVGFMTKVNANNFTTEENFVARYSTEITTFWQQGEFSSFSGVNKNRINYAIFNHKEISTTVNPRKCLIISPGRSEGYLKYKELSFDLFNLGFNIFIIDHRGQGISARLLKNTHMGYVDNFQYYVDDLATFVENTVKPYCNIGDAAQKPYLLAHSMGGAIAARYLQDHPNNIQAAVLSSPMLGFNSSPIPGVIAKSLIKITDQINQLIDDTPWYFFGQKDYLLKEDNSEVFLANPLMHSELRFREFNLLYRQVPELQLGGVTVKWLSESIKALDILFSNIDKIKTPTLVIQAGEDKIVSNEAQNDFCQQLYELEPQSCPNGKPLVIEGAYHELFFESDRYRQQALTAAVEWLDKH
jgi:lysophospholipase